METQSEVELVTKSDLLGLTMATWDRPRSTEQLLGFIARREAAISDLVDET
ncbi:MAG: hypothetical protein NTV39_00705 [Candidatus Saccharibacteria bacterium]|nr:hypothetical protein [Candidatus Saccharibacteria bacterium]